MIELAAALAGLAWLYFWVTGWWFAALLLAIPMDYLLLHGTINPPNALLYPLWIGFAWVPWAVRWFILHQQRSARERRVANSLAEVRQGKVPPIYSLMLKSAIIVLALGVTGAHAEPHDWHFINQVTGDCMQASRSPLAGLHSPMEFVKFLRNRGERTEVEILRDKNGDMAAATVTVTSDGKGQHGVVFFIDRHACEVVRAAMHDNLPSDDLR